MKNLLLLFMLISTITKAQNNMHNKPTVKVKNTVSEDMGTNIIAFSPFSLTVATGQDMPDMNVGISYEHISKNGYIGFKLPVVASLYNPYYTFMPTVKLYPGKQGTAKYAIGPQLLLATGNVKVPDYSSPYVGEDTLLTKQRSQFGFMLNNSFNFTFARHLYIGIDLSLGIIYYDNEPNAVYNSNDIFYANDNNSNNIRPCTHMGFNMGYRF